MKKSLVYLLLSLKAIGATVNIPINTEPTVTIISTNDKILLSSYGSSNVTRQVSVSTIVSLMSSNAVVKQDITNIATYITQNATQNLANALSWLSNNITTMPTYNVKNYGATGNGTTDDTLAIQAAINAASASGGGTIVFPIGTYAVTNHDISDPNIEGGLACLVINNMSNLVFRGESQRSTIKNLGVGRMFSVGTDFNYMYGSKNLIFDTLTMDGQYGVLPKASGSGTLIDLSRATNVFVNNCILINATEHAFDAETASGSIFISSCVVSNCAYTAIHGEGIGDNITPFVVTSCHIINNGWGWGGEPAAGGYGIDNQRNEQLQVINCYFFSNAIGIEANSGIFVGNTLVNPTNIVWNGYNTIMIGNKISDWLPNHFKQSIILRNNSIDGGYPVQGLFANNMLTTGIIVSNAFHVRITGNTFYGLADQIWFPVGATVTNCIFDNNYFVLGNNSSILIDSTGVASNVFKNNIFMENTYLSPQYQVNYSAPNVGNVWEGNTFHGGTNMSSRFWETNGILTGNNFGNTILTIGYGGIRAERNSGGYINFVGTNVAPNTLVFNSFNLGFAPGSASNSVDIASWTWFNNAPPLDIYPTRFTGLYTVLTNGTDKATLHITNGLIMTITAP